MVNAGFFGRAGCWLALVSGAGSALGCEPTFDDRNSEILDRRVLAVRVTPAQAKPDQDVALSALVVDPSGTLRNVALRWSFCNAAKPVAETNDVSAACLELSGDQFQDLGRGISATGKLPKDACRQFGPDVPQRMPGQAAGRPTDPDSTGGFYQPVRVIAPNASSPPIVALAQAGLICGQPSLTGEQLLDYQQRSRANEHPLLANVLVDGDDARPLSVDDGVTSSLSVRRGQRILLRATWPSCPSESQCGDGICGQDETTSDCADDCAEPKGCAGAEPYIYYDPLSRKLVERRESMRVAWFAGAGSFADDHTGRREDEDETFSDGSWTAPKTPGPVHLWVVLRDSRGGIDWQSYVVEVE
jgi:hypothetical protein